MQLNISREKKLSEREKNFNSSLLIHIPNKLYVKGSNKSFRFRLSLKKSSFSKQNINEKKVRRNEIKAEIQISIEIMPILKVVTRTHI